MQKSGGVPALSAGNTQDQMLLIQKSQSLLRKSDSVSSQANKCYLKHKQTGKEKIKGYRNERRYPGLKAKLAN